MRIAMRFAYEATPLYTLLSPATTEDRTDYKDEEEHEDEDECEKGAKHTRSIGNR